jgi:hypothetical protein
MQETANGVTTGKCVNTNDRRTQEQRMAVRAEGYMCELYAWCPVEYEEANANNVLPQVSNFTLFVRVDGRFPQLEPSTTFSNFENSKLVWNQNLFYLGDLVAAAELGVDLPVEPVQDILKPARLPVEHFERILEKGAEIVVSLVWNCDLDRTNDCTTSLRVDRIDGGKGFNYRSATTFTDPVTGETVRDVVKRYGLRVVFRIEGKGGKFDFMTLGVVLGSGLGLLGVATVIADLFLHTSKRLRPYQEAKFERVEEGSDQAFMGEQQPLEQQAEHIQPLLPQ